MGVLIGTVQLCDELLRQLRLRVGLSGKVRELLQDHMTPTNCASIAKQTHKTERTLRRKLEEERTFSEILAEREGFEPSKGF